MKMNIETNKKYNRRQQGNMGIEGTTKTGNTCMVFINTL